MRAKGREGGGEDVAGGDGIADEVLVLQMQALPRWFPGGLLPVVCAGPLQLRHGGGNDDQELVPRLQGLLVLQLRKVRVGTPTGA